MARLRPRHRVYSAFRYCGHECAVMGGWGDRRKLKILYWVSVHLWPIRNPVSCSYLNLLVTLNGGEPLTLHVFRNGARFEELNQVIRATRFGTDSGELEAAKWLPRNDRPRRIAVNIPLFL